MSKTETDKAFEEMVGSPAANETEEAGNETNTEATNSEETTEENNESAQTDSDVDEWKALSRKWEARAKENKEKADAHDALTTKVSELEAQLTESQAKADEVTKWKVAAKYRLSEEDVNLFLTASDEETLEKQAQRLSQSSAHAPKPDAAQGTRSNTGPLSTKQQGAAALEGLLN